VHEEGLAYEDYLHGLDILKKQQEIPALAAICAPGVGSLSILDEITEVCRLRHTVVIVRESDFYDFLTEK
jgi:hypothetical protein